MTPLLHVLLFFCPPAFRRECGEEILDLYAQRQARLVAATAPLRAQAALWWHTAADIVRTAAAEWIDVATSGGRPAAHAAADIRRMTVMDRITRDVRDAARRLVRTPGFSLSAILILAIGLGGTIAMFSAVDAFVLRPRPFADPDRLLNIYQDSDDGRPSSSSYPAYLDLASMTDLFVNVGATMPEGAATLLASDGEAQPVHVEYATSSYFPVLGLAPMRGRWFDPLEDVSGGPMTAVIGYQTWQRRFGGDPAIVGSTIRLSGAPVTVVGVAPRTFDGFIPGLSTEFWLSISSLGPVGGAFRGRTLTRREDHWFQITARLRPDGTVAAANAALGALAARLQHDFPETDRGRGITALPLDRVRVHPDIDAILFPAAGVYAVLASLILVVVCSNLATLLLARGDSRRREFAVRLALGASRRQIVASLLVESVLLSLAGGAAGLLLASWMVGIIGSVNLPLPVAVLPAIGVNGRVAAFGVIVSLLSAVVFGLLPAIRNTRSDLVPSLKDGSGVSTGARVWRRLGLRSALVTLQVAVSLALLAAGGILLRSTINATRVDLGFSAERIAVMSIDAGQAGHGGADGAATLARVRERVATLPGIEDVALASRIPLTPFGPSNTLVLDETAVSVPRADRVVEVEFAAVSPSYFDVLGLPILYGRGFSDADLAQSEPVAVVSVTMAKQFWDTDNVVGRRYRHEGEADSWVRIVGVAGDVPVQAPGEAPRPFAYRPMTQGRGSAATVLARTSMPPAGIVPSMRAAVRAIDPLIPIMQPGTMADHVSRSLAIPRAATQALVALGLLAVVLACFGVYSVVAFNVGRRTSEMGVRMAVGATSAQVTMLVVRDMMAVVLAGVIVGLGAASLLTPVLRRLLVGIEPLDLPTFGAVAALVALVALTATWIPARRAGRGDLTAVLRAE